MKRSVATALVLGSSLAAGTPLPHPALAQTVSTAPTQAVCNQFVKLRDDAQQKAHLVQLASQNKNDRKSMCDAMTRFSAAEGLALKFLEDNMVWCGVPQQAVTDAKANHDKTLKFRTIVCTEAPAPKPKAPTLSDAIATPSIDTGKNTKTGEGTFDTLTGNPLKR